MLVIIAAGLLACLAAGTALAGDAAAVAAGFRLTDALGPLAAAFLLFLMPADSAGAETGKPAISRSPEQQEENA